MVEAMTGCAVHAARRAGLTELTLETPVRRYGPLTLSLRGRHQVANAVVAVRLLEAIDAAGLAVPAEAVAEALATANWPARLTRYERPGGRALLVDGAHNPAGAAALVEYLAEEFPSGLPVVFGAMRDKQVRQMLAALAPVARPLIVTTAPGRRAAEAAALALEAPGGPDAVIAEPEIAAALERAWTVAPTIAVAGSLYLAGAVLDQQGLL
jgi:dihydrofolate synthase/folylpolyglutamate synthase